MADEKAQAETASVLDGAYAAFGGDVEDSAESFEDSEEIEDLDEVSTEDEDEESEESVDFSEDEEDDEDDLEEESDELPSVITVKADGKNVKIDFNNRDHITRVYQKYVAQARYQKERDDYKSQLDGIKASDSAESKAVEMVALLNENIENPKELLRLFTGGTEAAEKVLTDWQKDNDSFALLSEPEQKAYLNAKKQEAKQKDLDKREAALNRQVEDSESKKSNAELAEQQSLVTSAFEQHRFNQESDPDEALKLDKRLWNDVISRLGEYESVNKEIINKEMKDAADELRSLLGRSARVAAKKTKTKSKKQAKKAVAKAVAVEKEDKPTGDFMADLMSAMNPMN
jgi:hypothetical protein